MNPIGEQTSGEVRADLGGTMTLQEFLDAFLDGRPLLSLDVEDGDTAFDLPANTQAGRVLELQGYDSDRLVAAGRIMIR